MGYVWLDYSKTLTEHEVFTVDGIPKLKIVEGKIVKRALKEIEADRASLPPPPPTTDERVADVEEQLSQIKIAYQNGVNHA